ncbi:methyltransferase family protein [Paraburkholderia dinghuensis]|nr:isoprenylcysteine carboxylmethyltransferase family protein [Paraburkholderia dinghuensis]
MKPRIPPPVLMLAAAVIMWVLHRRFPLAVWVARPWNQSGSVVAAIGVAIGVAAVVRMHQAHTTTSPMDPGKASSLVTDGVFRISRNPIYLGMALLLTGWAIWLGSASPWIIPPLFVILITAVQIIPEEQALDQRFGEPYRAYQKRVARWIGRPV